MNNTAAGASENVENCVMCKKMLFNYKDYGYFIYPCGEIAYNLDYTETLWPYEIFELAFYRDQTCTETKIWEPL